ncbi:MAG: CapA family protein [Candidatus Hodarchaeota archaeon]
MQTHVPKDLRDRLALPWIVKKILFFSLKVVDRFNLWKYPYVYDPEKPNIKMGINLVWKSIHGMTRAEKGSGLEDHFATQEFRGINKLPAGFKPETTISLRAVGDLMKNPGIQFSRDKFYNNVDELIFGGDIAVANLESMLTKENIETTTYSATKTPKINATLEDYRALIGHSSRTYDIVCLSNNHALDRGEEGIQTTIAQLEEDGIRHFGVNFSPEDTQRCLIHEKNGIKLGFIGFTHSLNRQPFPEGKEYIVNYLPFHSKKFARERDYSPIKTQITYCKEQGCDLIILTLHWGLEYDFFPTVAQVEMARDLAEAGADVIISHHTHCIQPFEWHECKRDGGRIVPIFYGLGNLSANKCRPHVVLSLIASISITRGTTKDGFKMTLVDSVDIVPVFQLEKPDGDGYYIELQFLSDMVKEEFNDDSFAQYIIQLREYADLILGTGWNE